MNAPYWMKISKQQNKHTFGLNKFQFICVNHLFCVIFSLISSEKEFELGRWGFWRAYEGNPHKSIRTLCARFWQPIFGFAAYLLICIIFFSLLCEICFDICGAEFGFRFWFLLRCYVHIWYGFHVCLGFVMINGAFEADLWSTLRTKPVATHNFIEGLQRWTNALARQLV